MQPEAVALTGAWTHLQAPEDQVRTGAQQRAFELATQHCHGGVIALAAAEILADAGERAGLVERGPAAVFDIDEPDQR